MNKKKTLLPKTGSVLLDVVITDCSAYLAPRIDLSVHTQNRKLFAL